MKCEECQNFKKKEESAFQKWDSNHFFSKMAYAVGSIDEDCTKYRKEGWNAALDEIKKHGMFIKCIGHPGQYEMTLSADSLIEELKE